MNLFEQILTHPSFLNKPPVLFDIGASGAIHTKWKKIANYAICIAFDADKREFKINTSTHLGYKKLYTFNALVSNEEQNNVPFYLTKSPFCSSLLEPLVHDLTPYTFAPSFEVIGKTEFSTITIAKVLEQLAIDYIDWFKTDSQGIDLRLYKSIATDVRSKIIAAEFEPGFISAYQNEDTATDVLNFLKQEDLMWLADMKVKGNYRLRGEFISAITKNKFLQKLIMFSHNSSVGWAELLFLNKFEHKAIPLRDYLLGWLISTLANQHGHALYLIQNAKQNYNDLILDKLQKSSKRSLVLNVFKLKFGHAVLTKIRKMLGLA